MEIKNLKSNMINTYKNVANTKTPKEKGVSNAKVNSDNFDKLEFNFESSIAAAKVNIASSIDAEANTARIEQLQKMYAGDNCPVNAEQIANTVV